MNFPFLQTVIYVARPESGVLQVESSTSSFQNEPQENSESP